MTDKRHLYERFNRFLLEKLSIILNNVPDFITEEFMRDIMQGLDCSEKAVYSAIFARGAGLDIDNVPAHNELYKEYFFDMIHELENDEYENDPYYKTIRFPRVKGEKWSLSYAEYKPYQAFVCNDLVQKPDGRVIPQIGYFKNTFRYPVVYENGVEWMSITPNEIKTMQYGIEKAHGKVLTYGLGLGYYAFMTSRRAQVSSVTVVEREEEIIKLFEKHILCQFPDRDKIRIVHSDAFEYAKDQMANGGFDVVYTDLWHDPSDGVRLYQKMKELEYLSPKSEFLYWIEPTIQYYLPKKNDKK